MKNKINDEKEIIITEDIFNQIWFEAFDLGRESAKRHLEMLKKIKEGWGGKICG